VENKKGMIIKESVREGIPAEVILKLIEEEDIDLLILRSHEESRLERLLVGGVMMKSSEQCPAQFFL
jgi:nucleotide-binding universal stress UspA family protein